MRSARLSLAGALLLLSCGRAECPEWGIWEGGQCRVRDPWPAECPATASVELDPSGQLVSSSAGSLADDTGWERAGQFVRVRQIETPEEYDETLAQFTWVGGEFPTGIDFDENVVVAVFMHDGATCDSEHRVLDEGLADASTLVFRVEDVDGTCEELCSAYIARIVMYEVARPVETVAVCVEYEVGCDQ